MLVHRDSRGITVSSPAFAAEVAGQARGLASSALVSYDDAVSLAIDVGMFEAAAADALHADDSPNELLVRLRRASVEAARACLGAVDGELAVLRTSAAAVLSELEQLDRERLPPNLHLRRPEGFAHYALYPEAYARAAKQLVAERPCSRVACVGIRSIGTTLSAFVAAALEGPERSVTSWTLRPSGHPFERRAHMGAEIAARLLEPAPDLVLVIDEGPGLSGSSFASVAEVLVERGIPAARIVLMPSRVTDGATFVSERARRVWRRHEKRTASFDEVWLASGRLAELAGTTALVDVSEGRWRELFGLGTSPVINPEHERRKFVTQSEPPRLVKFAGLGRFGRALLSRSHQLEGTAASERLELRSGFFVRDVIKGAPLESTARDESLLNELVTYLADVHRRFARGSAADRDALLEMLELNARELMPGASLSRLSALLAEARALPAAPAVELDARMLPHEWLRTTQGFVKTDALEHHDDHFYPGPQDIAWDVAATIEELDLARRLYPAFINAVAARTRDSTLPARVTVHRAAYLAFRAAYCSLGSSVLAGTPDGARLGAARASYVGRLNRLLG